MVPIELVDVCQLLILAKEKSYAQEAIFGDHLWLVVIFVAVAFIAGVSYVIGRRINLGIARLMYRSPEEETDNINHLGRV
jgi:hypothetical protein